MVQSTPDPVLPDNENSDARVGVKIPTHPTNLENLLQHIAANFHEHAEKCVDKGVAFPDFDGRGGYRDKDEAAAACLHLIAYPEDYSTWVNDGNLKDVMRKLQEESEFEYVEDTNYVLEIRLKVGIFRKP